MRADSQSAYATRDPMHTERALCCCCCRLRLLLLLLATPTALRPMAIDILAVWLLPIGGFLAAAGGARVCKKQDASVVVRESGV